MARKKKKLARYPSDFTADELQTVSDLLDGLIAAGGICFTIGPAARAADHNFPPGERPRVPPAGRGEIIDITAETIEEEKALCIRNTAKTKQS